jgi:hypothetical protein
MVAMSTPRLVMLVLVAALAATSTGVAHAAAGDLDPSFDGTANGS